MKKIFIGLLAITILSGCISKTAQVLEFENRPLTEENSRVVSSPEKTFSVRVFNDHELALLGDQNEAQLFIVGDTSPGGIAMHIERYPLTMEAAIRDVALQSGVKELSREELVINDIPVTKITLETPAIPGVAIPLYFFDAGKNTYILRLRDDNPYEYFEAVISSFTLADKVS